MMPSLWVLVFVLMALEWMLPRYWCWLGGSFIEKFTWSSCNPSLFFHGPHGGPRGYIWAATLPLAASWHPWVNNTRVINQSHVDAAVGTRVGDVGHPIQHWSSRDVQQVNGSGGWCLTCLFLHVLFSLKFGMVGWLGHLFGGKLTTNQVMIIISQYKPRIKH